MSDNEEDHEKELAEAIQEIDKIIIKNILNYLKNGTFNNKTPQSYISAYTIIYKFADDENDSSTKLFNYYNLTINKYMNDICNYLNSEQDSKFLESFLNETEKTKILIHWMRKVFCYLDQYHTSSAKVGTLFENGLKNYFNTLFLPLKTRIFKNLTALINDHRDCKDVEAAKIGRVIKILKQVDLKNPVLNLIDDRFDWSGTAHKSEKGILNDWFYNDFITSTENYICQKTNEEISSLSAPEYIRSCLKYAQEEEERKGMFISKKFHISLDAINNKYLFEINSKIIATVRLSISINFMIFTTIF